MKEILCKFGFESSISIESLDDTQLAEIENGVNHQLIQDLGSKCDHIKTYESQAKFHFLLGHKILLQKWIKTVIKFHSDFMSSQTFKKNHAAFSPTLRSMIDAALVNYGRTSNARKFSKNLMDFAIYLYISAGKASYEILCANLPLPKGNTISKYFNLIFT